MDKIKIGLLPMYVKLYDDSCPEIRPGIDKFHKTIVEKFEQRGVEVITSEACRLENEFESAIKKFEDANVDVMVTLHLAYSPSLQSEKPLAKTKLPLLVLDTTPDYVYDFKTDAAALMYNHGIHGVQDMCTLLTRNKKDYTVFAGHYENSDVIDRVVSAAKGIKAAVNMKNAKVGIVGEPFDGMGDFRVPYDQIKKDIGLEVVKFDFNEGEKIAKEITQDEVDAEWKKACDEYVNRDVSEALYKEVAKSALMIRKWIKANKLTGFTMNFLETKKGTAFGKMPFIEACTQMADGVGYAGEGDVLTAGLVGALINVFPKMTFSEMFCPNWRDDSVFISHMGEYNIALAKKKPTLMVKPFPYTDAGESCVAFETMVPGKASMINLVPLGDSKYRLIIANGEILDAPSDNGQKENVNAWFKPTKPLAEFLETYSNNAGTHHGAVIYDADTQALKIMASYLGWESVEI